MPAFKKKIKKPKHTLGLAAYTLDKILASKLIKMLLAGKRLNAPKADASVNIAIGSLDPILSEISKENYKAHYLEDKVRYLMIDIVEDLKETLAEAKNTGYKDSNMIIKRFEGINKKRSDIKTRLKDIESDYY